MLFTVVEIRDTIKCSHHPAISIGKSVRKKGVAMIGNPVRRVAIIGFGEFGAIFGRDLAAAGISVSVFDILLGAEPSRTAMLATARNANLHPCDSLEKAIWSADLVISAVTCSAAADVARNSVPYL